MRLRLVGLLELHVAVLLFGLDDSILREALTARTLLGGGIILGATVSATLKRPRRQDAAL